MITLYIMNKKGYSVLKAIVEELSSKIIDQVVAARDKNVQYDYYDDIIKICNNYKIKFFERGDDFKNNSKYNFAVGWRWLISGIMNKLIIFHDSLLPKYRGFAPLVTSLIRGEENIGVTAFFAEKEFDRGDIINQLSLPVKYPIKISQAIDDIIPLYQKLAIDICKKIKNNQEIKGKSQEEAKATYSLWKDESDYCIDWKKSAHDIIRFINAVGFPYKGASTKIDGKPVRIIEAEEFPDIKIELRDVGKVIFLKDNYPIVVCGVGLIKIKKMFYDDTKKSALPLSKFRTRLGI